MGKGAERESLTIREWLMLIGMTCSAFTFNTSEFIPIGLLTDIGSTFSMTEAQTGLMITLYAWAVMLLSLPLMLLTSRIEMKRLLLGVIAVFFAGQVLAVLAPSFVVLVAARLLVACAHAVFWSIAAPIAARVVPAKFQPLALSMTATGTSVATILGLPLGRAIGLVAGWRVAFLCVGVVAAVAFVYLLVLLPQLPVTTPFTLGQLPSLLKRRALLGVYLTALLIATGHYVGYSYIEPFLLKVAGLGNAEVTMVLTIFGASGLGASLLFARLYDGHRITFIRVSVAAMLVSLALLTPAAGSLATVVALCVLWGLAATAFNVALQSEVLTCSPEGASAVATSIYSGTFNLGIGLGTAAGGFVADGPGLSWAGPVGAAVILVAVVYCFARFTPLLRSTARG